MTIEKDQIISICITVVLMLSAVLIGFPIVNMIFPQEFELFTSNFTEESIKEYFNNIEKHSSLGIYSIVLIDLLIILVATVLIRTVKMAYKPYSAKGKVLLISVIIAAIIMYLLSNTMNFGLAAEVKYFFVTYFWLS